MNLRPFFLGQNYDYFSARYPVKFTQFQSSDVLGEDPTVKHLEKMAAEITAKEDALFVVSGTMANLVSQMTHCGRGDEMILGDQSHIFYYEQGGSAAIAGIHPRIIKNQKDGTLNLDEVAAVIRPDDIHFPKTRLLALENTHNRCNGTPLTLEYMEAAGRLARTYGLKLHVDGARIFNAAISLRTSAAKLLADADSVAFCLSKGLAAPVGSLVCGSTDFIEKARRMRKVLGGGMRQAGIVAAAGIVALTQMVDRMDQDHANARVLAEGLAELEEIFLDPQEIQTNIVFFTVNPEKVKSTETFVQTLAQEGIKVLQLGPCQLRAVTHYRIERGDIDLALSRIKSVLGQCCRL